MWQRAHPQFYRVQFREAPHQVVGHDVDEAGGQAALGHENGIRARADFPDAAGDGDVLGEVEVVNAMPGRQLRHRGIAMKRQRRDHGVETFTAHQLRQRSAVRRIHPVGVGIVQLQVPDQRARHLRPAAGEVEPVIF